MTDNFGNRLPQDRLLTDRLFAHGTSFDRDDKSQSIALELAHTRPARHTYDNADLEAWKGPLDEELKYLEFHGACPLGDDHGRIDFTPTHEERTFPRAFSSPSFNLENIVFDLW